ncbi:tetratricopeptide repeat protein [Streptomyces sp. NBC_00996]|uniref:tetratricopeptide repeat protein n=1 Tax=Streptomyces sp. NBC_00996 TaxID=2903710 RepID=UPI003865F4B5|nr:tetratricopeptide repeat protein [Streptomyces sp. NBC_00996]
MADFPDAGTELGPDDDHGTCPDRTVMSAEHVRIPGHESGLPRLEDMPRTARRLAVVLSTATRIEPELMRTVRIRIRPDLDVGAESALWFGPWAHRNAAQYMALRPSLLEPLRNELRDELVASMPGDAVRRAGEAIFRTHRSLSPVLALEEQVTWAAVLADAGVRTPETDGDPQFAVDRLLERALRAAVETPERRDGLRRWFAGAWQRFPERVRQAPAALDLFDVLHLEGSSSLSPARVSAPVQPAHLGGVSDVILSVRHDGGYVTVGDPGWPAESVLVPDTQPRILEIAHDLTAWEQAEKVRVPRGGRMSVPVSDVPVYVRTARGVVYQLGAPGSSEVIGYPAIATTARQDRGLLGGPVTDLTSASAVRFGIAPVISPHQGKRSRDYRHPLYEVRTVPAPYLPNAVDTRLAVVLRGARAGSRLVVVTGGPASGRTRTAWEAMRRVLSDWWVWCPELLDRAQVLIDAVAHDQLGSQTVVWLDDIDLLLADALAGEKVAEALEEVLTDPARRPLLLLATARPFPDSRAGMGPRAAALLARAAHVQMPESRPDVALRAPFAGTGGTQASVFEQPRLKIMPRSELPTRTEGFVGRATELEQLFFLLGTRAARSAFAVVTGLSGAGKTALAVEAAHRARQRGWFPGGILWMNLAGQPFTPSRLLTRLGLSRKGQPDDEAAQWVVCAALLHQLTGTGHQPVLLVLDDAPSWEFDDLPSLAPGLSVLVTSHGEGPQRAESVVLGPLEAADAHRLLEARLASWEQAGGVGPEEEAARELVEACGRLPLALSVAAALLAADRTLTVPALVAAIEQAPIGLDALAYEEQSVRAAIDRSYSRLNPTQARVFRLLALLPTPEFTSPAAAALLGRPPERLLRRLVRLHLLDHEPRGGRWHMHSLVRQYAADLGLEHALEDEKEEAFERLMHHYRLHAEAADGWLRGKTPPDAKVFTSRRQAVLWLRSERVSLVAAVDCCLKEGRRRTAAAIALALAEFLTRGQHFEDLLHVMRAVLDSPGSNEDDQYTRAAALNNFALAMARTGNFEEALDALKRAAELHGRLGDRRAAYAVMLRNLGATLLVGNRPRHAAQVLRDAAGYYADASGEPMRAQVLSHLGLALLESGEPVQAIDPLLQAGELLTHVQAPTQDRAMLLANLGTALLRTGQREEAVAVLLEATALDDDGGSRRGQADMRERLGRAMMEAGLFAEAVRCLDDAVSAYGELADTRNEAQARNNLGLALLDTNRGGEAVRQLEDALHLYRGSGDALSAAQCSNNLGKALRRLGEHSTAVEVLSQTVADLQGAGDEAGAAEALLNLGLAQLAEGHAPQAQATLTASAEAHASLGNITGRAHALLGLSRAAMSNGDPQAVQYLRLATEAFRHGRSTEGMREALLLLSDLFATTGQKGEASRVLREALHFRDESAAESRALP